MKKELFFWQFGGFVFVSVVGTLLHFVYDWTQVNAAALFSAVNESIWEHIKLLFFPMFAFAIIEGRFIAKNYNNFWYAKLVGILLGIISIPALYYTYTGTLGTSADWFNIMIFYITAVMVFVVETKIIINNKGFYIPPSVAIAILCAVSVMFMIFTFFPPKIPLFEDPLTRSYGVIKKSGV